MITYAANSGVFSTAKNGDQKVRCILLSTETPESLIITGADVEGLDSHDIIAAGSVLITPEGNYIAFEDGVFTQKE